MQVFKVKKKKRIKRFNMIMIFLLAKRKIENGRGLSFFISFFFPSRFFTTLCVVINAAVDVALSHRSLSFLFYFVLCIVFTGSVFSVTYMHISFHHRFIGISHYSSKQRCCGENIVKLVFSCKLYGISMTCRILVTLRKSNDLNGVFFFNE